MKKQDKLVWYKEEFEKIHQKIKNKKSLSHYDFLRIRNFKIQNFTPEKQYNITKITFKAFNLAREDKIKEAISLLQQKLDGIAIPIASAILAMKYPANYAIIDRKAINALKRKDWLKDYLKNPQTYNDYLILMRRLAKGKNMHLRDFERSLFENGKV